MNVFTCKALLLQLFLVVIASACSPKAINNNSAAETVEQGVVKRSVFSVLPKTVSGEDNLRISLPIGEGPSKLAIISPEGVWYVVHDASEGIYVISEKDFSDPYYIDVFARDLKGVVWIDGEKEERSVFSSSGVYTFYLADNLETEPDNTFFLTRKIRFVGN